MAREMIRYFPYEPTADQHETIKMLVKFLAHNDPAAVFILKGYAGTGKTSLVSSLAKALDITGNKPVLLAPTGRAAKVLASYTGKQAHTIHRKIYRVRPGSDGSIDIALQINQHKQTIFIVDEASMIADSLANDQTSLFRQTNLLDDLIRYVYSGKSCRLILIGDTAQLPPVGSAQSPALDPDWMKNKYHLTINTCEMKDVVRQSKESGILYNATTIRNSLLAGQAGFPKFKTNGFDDFIRLNNDTVSDQIMESFDHRNLQESLIICRSNKRAYLFNQHIRNRILFMEDEMNTGDLLMVVKNNYFWLKDDFETGFIANGDMISVKRVQRNEHVYGFKFADIEASLTDYPEAPNIEVKIMLDTLASEQAALGNQQSRSLFDAIAEDFQEVTNKSKKLTLVRGSNHYQALQVKYGYALTCHKSQGGQWRHVFIDMGYLPGQKPDSEYLRWLYTAITRATEKVFLLNFHDEFFEI